MCGCGKGSDDHRDAGTESASDSYAKFRTRFDAGASCEELFAIRNSADPKSPDIERMNYDLQGIQCYSSSSLPSDRSPAVVVPQPRRENGSKEAGGFTVRDYRVYRAIMSAPATVPEAQVIQSLADRNGMTPSEIRGSADTVQRALSQNNWFGNPDTEIRHASDWNGE